MKKRKGIFSSYSCSNEALIHSVKLGIAKWASVRREFINIKLNDILFNWEASVLCSAV